MAKHGIIIMIAGTAAVAAALYLLHKTTQPTTRIPSMTPPPKSSKQTCPKDCPMLRNNKCISNNCILTKPKTNITPAKAGEAPEAISAKTE